MEQLINSSKNQRVKNLILLQSKSRERKKQGSFVVEGLKELELLSSSNFEVEEIYYSSEQITQEQIQKLKREFPESEFISLGREPYKKVAYRESTGGVIASVRTKTHTLQDLQLSDNPFVVVVESVEKPGNLGALLRTADGVGVDALIICDPLTDVYNPNVIRSSLGCIFSVPVAVSNSYEAINWLQKNSIHIFSTALTASIPYYEAPFDQSCAIVLGTEATGLSDLWLNASDQNIIIPMLGKIDSLNVSVAAGIAMYEARRQRLIK